jgi:micrococcal nuclease
MGRGPRRFFARGAALFLVLLVAAVAAAIRGIPKGTSPAVDRAREEADRLLAKLPKVEEPKPAPAAPAAPAAGTPLRSVVRIVDGDTLVLDGNERVRLIGINTPESVDPRRPVQWYGKEAAAWTRKELAGKKVRLAFDVEPKDKYGRTLAYVFLENGTFFNLRLVEEGYAFSYPYPPNVAHVEEFRAAERKAREAGRGLWSDPDKAKALIPKSRK